MAEAIECTISEETAASVLAYLDAMLEENLQINLTGVRDREEAVVLHALDSLAMGNRELGLKPRACLDLGTGNGFPGVVMAFLFPEAEVVLMDRTLKKLRAIERCMAAVGIDAERVRTLQMDAAAAPAHGHAGKYDLVTARAVGEARKVGDLARPMLTIDGSLLIWMSADQHASAAIPRTLRSTKSLAYDLPPPASRQRILARFER